MKSSLDEVCEARVGTLFNGKWTLERVLGVGGMAAVYVGVHKIGRRDAIKILHTDVARSPDLKRRFEQEASATNRFRHPGAVEIRDFDVADDGCPFLVMELLEGESLGERARRLGGIEEVDLLQYTDELLDVLAAAHKEGIIHRDIKLDNLFITTDGHLKVLDFGIARVRSGPSLTVSGMRLGTTAYMPPEQVRGLDIDGRADLFAVGATMFRLLAKRRIHEADDEGELVVKMATDPAPKLLTVTDDASASIALVVDRALEFSAEDRYPNAETMQEDIRRVRNGEPPAYALARATPANGSSGPFKKEATPFGKESSDEATRREPSNKSQSGQPAARPAAPFGRSPSALTPEPTGGVPTLPNSNPPPGISDDSSITTPGAGVPAFASASERKNQPIQRTASGTMKTSTSTAKMATPSQPHLKPPAPPRNRVTIPGLEPTSTEPEQHQLQLTPLLGSPGGKIVYHTGQILSQPGAGMTPAPPAVGKGMTVLAPQNQNGPMFNEGPVPSQVPPSRTDVQPGFNPGFAAQAPLQSAEAGALHQERKVAPTMAMALPAFAAAAPVEAQPPPSAQPMIAPLPKTGTSGYPGPVQGTAVRSTKSSSALPIVLGLGALLAVGAGVGWFVFLRPTTSGGGATESAREAESAVPTASEEAPSAAASEHETAPTQHPSAVEPPAPAASHSAAPESSVLKFKPWPQPPPSAKHPAGAPTTKPSTPPKPVPGKK